MVSRVHPRYEYILEVLAPVSSCWFIDPDWGGVGGIRHHGVRGCVVIRRERVQSVQKHCVLCATVVVAFVVILTYPGWAAPC